MKFIKYAVGLVIALSVIPLVVVTVTNLDAPRLKTIEFEVEEIDLSNVYFSENAYNKIHALAIVDTNGNVSNLVNVKLNGVDESSFTLNFDTDDDSYYYVGPGGTDWTTLINDDTAEKDDYNATIGDKWTMTFELPKPPLPPLIKLLVGFAPLLFVGGVLLFMLNKRKFE